MKKGEELHYFCAVFHSHLPDAEIATLAEACLRFTPDLAIRYADADGRCALFLEVSRCLAIYSEASLETRLLRFFREWKIPSDAVSLAKSTNLARAWLAASHRTKDTEIGKLPISAIEGAIDPLGHRAHERSKIRGMSETLFLLGIRTLGGLKKLPPDSAVSRFGGLYEMALRNLGEMGQAEEHEAWERFKPTEKMLERIELDPAGPIWEIEPVLFHTKSLLDRLLRRAAGRGKALARLELRVECEKRKNVREAWSRIRVDFTFPQTSASLVLRTLREKLAFEFERKPLEAPIAALECEALELAPRRSAQSNFLADEDTRIETAREGWRDLVTELTTKLAAEKEVYQAELIEAWRPEKSWKRVLKDPERVKSVSLPIPERPLEVLNPPEPLRRLGRYLFWNDERFTIQSFTRLERLSGEWWEDHGGFTRTYYRVKAERELWIFREQNADGSPGGIYLHGLF
jgi:hypothetical protein